MFKEIKVRRESHIETTLLLIFFETIEGCFYSEFFTNVVVL